MSVAVVRRAFAPLRKGLLLATSLGALLGATPCSAQAVEPREALADAKAYFTAPLHWDKQDWLYFGGTVASLAVVHPFDDDVRDHYAGSDASALDGKDPRGTDDAIAAAALVAGTWLLAGLTDDPAGWRELGSMLEASAFTLVSTEVFKYSLGRTRPNETTDPDEWFAGGDSFPSMHSSLAFAIGTVFAESGNENHRLLRRIVGYGVAGATAYARVEHNAHWTTDVIAGAALGLATAQFTLHRREGEQPRTAFSVTPAEGGGVMLSFALPLH
jgi:membrane-associated phospholipid phosphatase